MASEEKGGPTKVKFGKNKRPVFADDNKLSKTEGNSDDDDAASSSVKTTPRVKFTTKKKTFPQVSFSTFEGMIEQGIPCPVELVREGDRELARKLLDEQLKEMETFPITEAPPPTFKKRKSVHDSIADRKPALKPSPEREQANKKKGRWMELLILMAAATVCSLAYAMEIGAISNPWGNKSQPPPYSLLPIYTDFPTADRRCLPVTFEMYRNLKESKSHEWEQMADSMQKHSDRGYPAFSAFRVGKPYCYMTIKTADNQTIAMINPEVVGVNLDSSVMREEKSINCLGKSKHVNRYRDVWVRYQDPSSDFDVIERKISDRVGSDDVFSFIFQSEYNYLNGRSICDNTEKGAESLIEIMREGRSVIRPHHSASK